MEVDATPVNTACFFYILMLSYYFLFFNIGNSHLLQLSAYFIRMTCLFGVSVSIEHVLLFFNSNITSNSLLKGLVAYKSYKSEILLYMSVLCGIYDLFINPHQ